MSYIAKCHYCLNEGNSHYGTKATELYDDLDYEVFMCQRCEPAAQFERNRIIDLLKRQVCFDALADHELMETFRHAHPEVVGRCSHHGGKCTDLLLLIGKLENQQ